MTIHNIAVRDLSDPDQFVVISNLRTMLDQMLVPGIKHIVVEKQIGKFGFKQLEYAIFMYVQLRYATIPVHSIHPSHKLKIQFHSA